MEKLVIVVQKISLARDLDTVMKIVRKAARDLTGADGATFVLQDNGYCYYADEDAISPLWKGQRFPVETCISGWVMKNARPAVIADIYKDPRIPRAVYQPTFVKSLAMVPIRQSSPVGAIGNYWARKRIPTDEELSVLQTLANITSVAMENVSLYKDLQDKIKALEISNAELRTFSWAAAHDLKTPLRGVNQLTRWIEEDLNNNDTQSIQEHVEALHARVSRIEDLLDSIFEYSQDDQNFSSLKDEEYVTGDVLEKDIRDLLDLPEGFHVEFTPGFRSIEGPRTTLLRIFFNLIGNGIKHHDTPDGTVQIDAQDSGALYEFSVKDNGPGIDPAYHDKIFEMFQTLKPKDIVEGSGMGLPLVKKILARHGGEISLESAPGEGSVFKFTWPRPTDKDNERRNPA